MQLIGILTLPNQTTTSNPIIFLDFDGVLNRWIDNELVEWIPGVGSLVNLIIDATNADIVVSSSWRRGRSLERLRGILEALGVTQEVWTRSIDELRDSAINPDTYGKFVRDVVIDKTSKTQDHELRGDVIQRWLDDHPEVTSFVIIDDNTDMKHFTRYLVKTEGDVGLTIAHAQMAINILQGSSYEL